MRVRAQGAAEKGSEAVGTVTIEVAASADMVVHIAAVLRSRGRTPGRLSPRRASRPSPRPLRGS
ncbi:hypothetical protein GCM10010266_08850 [Streptomyces griseomycini]|nr:hypothetical protein GCM10010266_08850 [Streptomyces griseomycini]GGR16375.1 hypothetical protein GCM10015536_22430 [Streptomyces griseomycini]